MAQSRGPERTFNVTVLGGDGDLGLSRLATVCIERLIGAIHAAAETQRCRYDLVLKTRAEMGVPLAVMQAAAEMQYYAYRSQLWLEVHHVGSSMCAETCDAHLRDVNGDISALSPLLQVLVQMPKVVACVASTFSGGVQKALLQGTALEPIDAVLVLPNARPMDVMFALQLMAGVDGDDVLSPGRVFFLCPSDRTDSMRAYTALLPSSIEVLWGSRLEVPTNCTSLLRGMLRALRLNGGTLS